MSDQLPEGSSEETPKPSVPSPLIAFMSANWEPPTPVVDAPSPAAPFHRRRREALAARFPGEWLIVPTGGLKVRANDTDYRFRAGTDFAWLTGSHEPDAVLVIDPEGAATLFSPPRADRSTPAFFTDRRYGELWVGPRLGLEDTTLLLGIETAPLDELEAVLKEAAAGTVRVARGYDQRVESQLGATDDERDAEVLATLSELRLVKDEHEIECLQAAVDATVIGFEDVVRSLPTAQRYSERWVEGTFNRRARTEGNDVGYDTIAASGPHACTLHWVRNDGPVGARDLLLLDAGVEGPELYTADVTRTVPVSGRFSRVQREVYDAVWRAQRAGIAECRPGQPFMAPHRAAMRVLTEWLVEIGILRCTVDEALDPDHRFYTRYALHGTSHMLGLDVHDCANTRNDYRDHDLVPGMVLTVEPGCYFQPDDLTVPKRYRGIGVRIEDDVVVTEDGCRVLSEALPTQADEVEAWMAPLLKAGRVDARRAR
ncbi:MAG TPA: aminopeptidase P family protein [Acidimicrobiales bacterium]|nr:aminopeptidase P family protein [Acidimicrobiales bacterium]